MRGCIAPALAAHLTYFALPLGARRRLDASRFLAEAGNTKAAEVLDRQARLLGRTQLHAVRRNWPAVAALMVQFAEDERALLDEM